MRKHRNGGFQAGCFVTKKVENDFSHGFSNPQGHSKHLFTAPSILSCSQREKNNKLRGMLPDVVSCETKPIFKKIYLEISNICNLQCGFCPPVKRDKAILSADRFRSYLQSIRGFSERVCLHVMGEPLDHKEFPSFVTLANESGVTLEITSNGTLLNKSNQEALLNPCVAQVNFSVQSFFDNFPNAKPTRYIECLFGFCQQAIAKRPDLYINFRLWNLQESSDHQNINTDFLRAVEREFGVELNPRVDPAFQKSKKIRDRVYLRFDSRFEWPEESRLQPRSRGTCYGSRTHIAIHANGDVVPCCLDKEAQIRLQGTKSLFRATRFDRKLNRASSVL